MKFIVAILFTIISLSVSAQNKLNPVKWTFEVEEGDDHYTLKASAKLDKGWAIYSQHTAEGGPVPLGFTYDASLTAIGATTELSTPIKKMSDLFEVEVIKFKNEARFEQKFAKTAGLKNITGEIYYMSCDDMRCLPPTVVPFDVSL